MSNTTDIIFDVFKEIPDHFDWEKHIEYATRHPELEQEKKEKWVNALRFLQNELGDSFLRVSDKNHPLLRKVIEKAPWRTTDLIAFADTLKVLKQSESNYSKLIGKMISQPKCETEGVPFTEIAEMYLKAGFAVRFPDETEGQKNPDMELSFAGSRFYIEVSKLGESDERKLLNGNYKTLAHTFNFEGYCVPFSCAQLRYISPEEMPEVIDTINSVRERAFQQNLVVYHSDDKIRLAVAHPEKFDELEKWIEGNDYRKGLLGVPLNFNETGRISNYKIRQEIKQIPVQASGLIYIPANVLYFWGLDIEETVRIFQRQMDNHPNLFGVVIFAYLIHDISPVHHELDGHFYSIKKMNEAVIRHLLFVRNCNYQGSLPAEIIQRIYTSFD